MFTVIVRDKYYFCENDAAVKVLSLKILTRRFNEGIYRKPETPVKPDVPKRNSKAYEELSKQLREYVNVLWKNHGDSIKRYDASMMQYLSIEKGIQEQDGELAQEILMARTHYEGETFKVIPLINSQQAE